MTHSIPLEGMKTVRWDGISMGAQMPGVEELLRELMETLNQ